MREHSKSSNPCCCTTLVQPYNDSISWHRNCRL